MPSLNLNGPDLERVSATVLDAFDHDTLGQMLKFRLNQDVAQSTSANATMKTVVFDVIQAAERQGWSEELLREATAFVPGNKALADLAAELLANVSTGPISTAPTAKALSKQAMSDADVRKMLTTLAPGNFATLIANIPGAASQVPSNGVVAERALSLIQWAESPLGPGLIEVGSIAKEVLPSFR